MRLTCPGCGAVYEVPDDAIPETGRDVVCTSCSHGWFQLPRAPGGGDLGLPDDPRAGPRDAATGRGVEDPASGDGLRDPFAEDGPGASEGPRRSSVDPRTRRVLREEAEREVEARRVERRRLRAIDDGPSAPPAGRPPGGGAHHEPRLRERIEPPSAQEAGLSPAAWDEDARRAEARRGRGTGFALGFLGTLAVAAVLTAGYLYAEALSEAVPALAEPMAAYAQTVSEARVALDAAAGAAAVRLDELLPAPAGGS